MVLFNHKNKILIKLINKGGDCVGKSRMYFFTWLIAVILAGVVASFDVTAVEAANTKNTVDKVLYVDDDYKSVSGKAENNIIIREDDLPFSTEDTFRLSLPSGVNWLKDEYQSNVAIKIVSTTTTRDLELQIIDPSKLVGDAKKEIKIPLYFEVDGAEGEIKLTIDPRDSTLSGGQYTIAVVGVGQTFARVDKVQTVYNDHSFSIEDASILRIDESATHTITSGDIFRIELPPGVKWNNDVGDFIKNEKGTVIDNQTLEVEIQEETNKLRTIYIPLMVTIDGFRGELQVHIVPLDSKVTEEKVSFAQVIALQVVEKGASFPKTKINVKTISYDNSFGSLHADEGFTFAKINMDVWIEEEPKDKVSWLATDFLSKWVLNDGREISEGSLTAGSSSSAEAGKWNNVAVALEIRDYQKIVSIFLIDPLNAQNIVEVPIEELDKIELTSISKRNSIELTWNSLAAAESYTLYRSKGEDELGEFDSIATLTTQDTIYIDSNVQPNITYWYKISAVKDGIEFLYSNLVKAVLTVSNNGGSTGGGGPSSDVKEISALNGGSIEKAGAKIDIPANAHTSSIKVTIKKMTNTSSLVIPENSSLISDVYEITKDKSGDFDKAVTITLPFDKSKYDVENYNIGVFWYNEVLEKWVALDNVEVDANSGKVSGEVNHFTKFAVIATVKEEQKQGTLESVEDKDKPKVQTAVQFSDVRGHWAEKAITQLVNEEYISGYPNQTFRPNQTITRAEFASILMKVLHLKEVDAGKVFNDTEKHWAKQAIATAHSHGIINGYNKSIFGANDPITREQMAAMIVNAFKLEHTKPLNTFNDESKTSKWAMQSLETAIAEGIIGGYEDGTIRPQGNTTRGESAVIIVRALNR